MRLRLALSPLPSSEGTLTFGLRKSPAAHVTQLLLLITIIPLNAEGERPFELPSANCLSTTSFSSFLHHRPSPPPFPSQQHRRRPSGCFHFLFYALRGRLRLPCAPSISRIGFDTSGAWTQLPPSR